MIQSYLRYVHSCALPLRQHWDPKARPRANGVGGGLSMGRIETYLRSQTTQNGLSREDECLQGRITQLEHFIMYSPFRVWPCLLNLVLGETSMYITNQRSTSKSLFSLFQYSLVQFLCFSDKRTFDTSSQTEINHQGCSSDICAVASSPADSHSGFRERSFRIKKSRQTAGLGNAISCLKPRWRGEMSLRNRTYPITFLPRWGDTMLLTETGITLTQLPPTYRLVSLQTLTQTA